MTGSESPDKVTTFEHIFKQHRFETEQHLANIEAIEQAVDEQIVYGYKGHAILGIIRPYDHELPLLIDKRFDCPVFSLEVIASCHSDGSSIVEAGTLINIPLVSNREKSKSVRRTLVYSGSTLPGRSIEESPYHALIGIGIEGISELTDNITACPEGDFAMSSDKAAHSLLVLLGSTNIEPLNS